MSDEFETIARLRALAETPVDEALTARHAELLAQAAVPATTWARRNRLRTVVAGGTLGFALIAGTGLAAAAGNLPDPAQDAAHAVLAKVGVNVPRSTEGCNGKTYKNHGQFMKDQPKTGEARSAAAKSKCGKPVQAGTDADENETPDADEHKGAGAGAEHGKPETPGKSTEDHGKPDSQGSTGDPGDAGKATAPGQAKKSGK